MSTGLALILVFVVGSVIPLLARKWLTRHRDEVDDYYEREYRDPLIIDGISWSSGR